MADKSSGEGLQGIARTIAITSTACSMLVRSAAPLRLCSLPIPQSLNSQFTIRDRLICPRAGTAVPVAGHVIRREESAATRSHTLRLLVSPLPRPLPQWGEGTTTDVHLFVMDDVRSPSPISGEGRGEGEVPTCGTVQASARSALPLWHGWCMSKGRAERGGSP
jgi:hypothetical protein